MAEAVAWWIREEKSSQHTVYPHNAWNGVLQCVHEGYRASKHSLIVSFLLCEPLLGMLRALRGNRHACNDSSPPRALRVSNGEHVSPDIIIMQECVEDPEHQ